MTADRLYILPLTTVSGPQAVEGDAVRLAGGMVYAREFVVIVRREDAVVSREVVTAAGLEGALARLPEELRGEAETQWSNLRMAHPALALGERTIRLDQPQVVGILNVTPDSFSDGDRFMDDPEEMRAHAAAMHEAGAAMIDVGGESTRPGAKQVWEGQEIERVIPAVEHCVSMGAAVSIDTRRPAVMEAARAAGAHMVNDVSGLRYDPRSLEFVAASDMPVILMHAPGTGEDLHAGGDYDAVVFDVFDMLKGLRDRAIAGGVARERI
ncbi:MAG: dihydropteroate synthase, partial [Alteraurantiacibacter sp.]